MAWEKYEDVLDDLDSLSEFYNKDSKYLTAKPEFSSFGGGSGTLMNKTGTRGRGKRFPDENYEDDENDDNNDVGACYDYSKVEGDITQCIRKALGRGYSDQDWPGNENGERVIKPRSTTYAYRPAEDTSEKQETEIETIMNGPSVSSSVLTSEPTNRLATSSNNVALNNLPLLNNDSKKKRKFKNVTKEFLADPASSSLNPNAPEFIFKSAETNFLSEKDFPSLK